MTAFNKIVLALATIGALNWGSVGLFGFDFVAWIFGGPLTVLARIVYAIVGLAGIFCLGLLFNRYEAVSDRQN